ncbi:MAG: S9 family peptidase [Chitinophagales bacterium]|nr:S9 family peptidase [Chitinophagales bacterium]MDW8427032.1 S9 family peptidase [Chitinophagales bacterium]
MAGLSLIAASLSAAQQRLLPITIESLDSLVTVSDPQLSPEGTWVAYTVTSTDIKKDLYNTDLWMVSYDGSTTVQLTFTPEEDENHPRWSPDGRYLAFLSSRKLTDDDTARTQLWLLNRLGGEARRLTNLHASITDYAWSPDGKHLALIVYEEDTVPYIEGTQTPKPIVIDRLYFKEDYSGYLTTQRHKLYLMHVDSPSAVKVLEDDFEEYLPSWSPDGRRIAFVSKRARPDWDADNNFDIWIVEARAGATPVRVTPNEGADNDPAHGSYPAWSPDGQWIAYSHGGPLKYIYYGTQHLAVARTDGSSHTVLTRTYDRNIVHASFSADGKQLYFLAEDDQNLWLLTMPSNGGPITRLLEGRYTITDYHVQQGRIVVRYSNSEKPYEIYALENGQLRQLTHHNTAWLQRHRVLPVYEFEVNSKDGTRVKGHYVLPYDYEKGKKYPCVLQIHGGPAAQNQNEWYEEWQLYGSWGYVLVSMNPRGSTGFGQKHALGIFGRWGSVDLDDNLAGLEELVRRGIADPQRLAVEGWSYGGIATNFLIARDQRFRCAISGAGIGNALAGFGTDQYIREYLLELGTPWRNLKNYLENSYPFLQAHKIKTPTLFMCGEKDFNVPLLNSEQMYQALRVLGVDTELVIYPDQHHWMSVPSYVRDIYERRKQWLEKYLK